MIEKSDLPPALVRADREQREVTLLTETGQTRVGIGTGTSRIEEEGEDAEIIVTTEVDGVVVTRADRAGTDTKALPGIGMNTGRAGTVMNTHQAMGTVVGDTLEGTDISL